MGWRDDAEKLEKEEIEDKKGNVIESNIEEKENIEKLEQEILEDENNKNIIEKVGQIIENGNKEVVDLKNEIVYCQIDKLIPSKNQPFKMYSNNEKEILKDSIKNIGIRNPILVRPIEEQKGFYEILSGHNRVACAKELEMKEVPCLIEDVDEEEAKLILVDSNIQRETISTMERAKAYKIKLDVYKKKNITSLLNEQRINKEDEITSKLKEEQNVGIANIYRLIRLTYLTNEFQQLIDEKKISIKAGEQLSYLDKKVQKDIYKILKEKDEKNIKITEKNIKNIRKLDEQNNINYETLFAELNKNQKKEKEEFIIKFSLNEKEEFFKNCNTSLEIKEYIFQKLKENMSA